MSLPNQISRADFGNLLFELCAKLGFNNVNQINNGDLEEIKESPKNNNSRMSFPGGPR